MKILHTCEYYWPSVGGAQEVVKQISERLVALGHEVTVATTHLPHRESMCVNGVNVISFDVKGNYVKGMTGEVDAYRRFLVEGDFDIVMFYAAQQWTFDASLEVLSKMSASTLLCTCGFSGLISPSHETYFKILPDHLRNMAGLIFHSKVYQDYQFCDNHKMTNMHWIANGASETEFTSPALGFRDQYKISKKHPMLLTIGKHTGVKGHATTLEAFYKADIGPSSLVIIGNNPIGYDGCSKTCNRQGMKIRIKSLGRKRVYLLDPPRAEVVSALFEADLFVFPSNIECSPLVLFECAAAGLPFLASKCGNSAEIAQWTQNGSILPTSVRPNGYVDVKVEDLARQIESQLRRQPRPDHFQSPSRAIWKEKFTWSQLALQYEQLYTQCMQKNRELQPSLQHDGS